MPKGRKKADTTNVILNSEKTNAETATEIAAPVEVKAEQPKKEVKSEKPKNKAGRKPKSSVEKSIKTAAAPKSEASAKAAASADTEKSKSKAGRKPKNEKAVAEEAAKTDKKAADSEKKTPAKRGRKPSNNTSKKTAPVPAPADTASVTAEKPKRTNTKKANSTKTAKTEDVIIQSNGNEYSMSDITEMCKNDYRGGTRKQIKSIKVYVKAENNVIRAYYVVNDSASGHIDL